MGLLLELPRVRSSARAAASACTNPSRPTSRASSPPAAGPRPTSRSSPIPATGAWIADPYNLPAGNPFEVVGGTSLSAPAWAGLLALVNQGRAAAGEPALNSTSPTETQQALYSLPQSDYNVITSGNNGYTASAGYNLVTGLGTPVANLLVPDLVAYQGPGTTYTSGPTVGPLQDATLVDTGASAGGPINVFSVFDSFTVTSNAVGFRHDANLPTIPPAGSDPLTVAGFSPVASPVSLVSASASGTVVSVREVSPPSPLAASVPVAIVAPLSSMTLAPPVASSIRLAVVPPGIPIDGARAVQPLSDPTGVGARASSLIMTIDKDQPPALDPIKNRAALRRKNDRTPWRQPRSSRTLSFRRGMTRSRPVSPKPTPWRGAGPQWRSRPSTSPGHPPRPSNGH